jgi:replicative DNA helicase
VDYLQLMRGSSGRAESRQLEIAEISRSIKGLARELRCPVVALSQLSREAERDDSGAPKLSHLRESGAIEQDADVVIMLSRPGASRLQQLEERYGDGVDPNKIIQVDLAKQRNGPTGRIELLFDRNIQHFGDLVGPGEVAPPPSFEQTNRDAEDMLGDDEVPF